MLAPVSPQGRLWSALIGYVYSVRDLVSLSLSLHMFLISVSFSLSSHHLLSWPWSLQDQDSTGNLRWKGGGVFEPPTSLKLDSKRQHNLCSIFGMLPSPYNVGFVALHHCIYNIRFIFLAYRGTATEEYQSTREASGHWTQSIMGHLMPTATPSYSPRHLNSQSVATAVDGLRLYPGPWLLR